MTAFPGPLISSIGVQDFHRDGAYGLGGAPDPLPIDRRANGPVATQARQVGRDVPRDVGRRSGQKRIAILGYFEDGPNVGTIAMNGWADGEPSWWLNLQGHADTTVHLKGETRAVRGREAKGEERARLWGHGERSTTTSTRMPRCGQRRRRSLFWSPRPNSDSGSRARRSASAVSPRSWCSACRLLDQFEADVPFRGSRRCVLALDHRCHLGEVSFGQVQA